MLRAFIAWRISACTQPLKLATLAAIVDYSATHGFGLNVAIGHLSIIASMLISAIATYN